MNFESYRQFRSELLIQKSLLRFDCMNPVRALSNWAPVMPESEEEATCIDKTLLAWKKATMIALHPEQTVIGRGIRELISATFTSVLRNDGELWLPDDVYPVYWNIAADAGLKARSFSTLPQPAFDFLTQTAEHATVVLPVPLSPLGRLPDQAETDALLSWLRGSPHRLLIIDAVYTFDFDQSRSFMDIFLGQNADQSIVLWSCSKSWLLPRSLGIAAVPRRLAPTLRGHVAPPTQAVLGRINGALEGRPDLSNLLQKAFTLEWQRLAPIVRAADHNWQPPPSGYFSVVKKPFTTLLNENGILSVPASVFGARRDDLSIVTCLHDLSDHIGIHWPADLQFAQSKIE